MRYPTAVIEGRSSSPAAIVGWVAESPEGTAGRRRPGGRHDRGSEEFTRVLAFSDGLFAIAMTLLVVGITVPALDATGDETELARALSDLSPSFISFGISFFVIGRYWLAHHQFFSMLAAVDSRLIKINLVYLAFIAFLPFPTDLLGTYFDNAISVATYAVTVAAVSGLEVAMFHHARQARLLRSAIPDEVYRWGILVSLSPVVFFAVSVPVAFYSVDLAVAIWFLFIPFQFIASSRKPSGTDEYLS